MNFSIYRIRESHFLLLTYFAWCFLAAFVFLSIGAVTLFYILIAIPGIYYTFVWIKTRSSSIPKSFWCLLAFSILAFISSMMNWLEHGDKGGVSKIKYFLMGALSIAPTYRLLISDYFSQRKKKILISIFLISTILANVIAIVTFFMGHNPLQEEGLCAHLARVPRRTCGMYGMTMTYGYGVSLLSLLLLGLVVNYQKCKELLGKNILIISTFLSCLGFFLSFSRGAFFAFVLASPLLFVTLRKKYPIRFYGYLSIPLFIAMIMILSFYGHLPEGNIQNRYLASKSFSFNQRIKFYKVAYYEFKENPFWGIGYRNFFSRSLDLQKKYGVWTNENIGGDAHNNYLEVLVGTGIFAFLFFLAFLFFWMREILKTTGWMRSLFLPFCMGFLISGLFQSTIISRWNMFFIMGVFALFQALELKRKHGDQIHLAKPPSF